MTEVQDWNIYGLSKAERKKKKAEKKAAKAQKKAEKKATKSQKKAEKKKKKAEKKSARKAKRKAILLKPFKRLMTRALDKRKIKFNNSNMEDIAVKFYNAIVLRKTNFETQEVFGLDPVTISAIVTGVLNFLADLIRKKKDNAAMNEEEKEMASEAEVINETAPEPKDEDEGPSFLDRILQTIGMKQDED